MMAAREHVIADLRSLRSNWTVSRSGVGQIDEVLQRGGLARGALHEFAGGGAGTVDGAAAALFVAGSLRARKARSSGV